MAMEIEKNNNKELVPLEHYLEEYKKADPEEISVRTGFAYDSERKVFTVTFLHRIYEISFPDFEIICLDEKYEYSPLLETNPAKILMVRFLLEGAQAVSTGKFLTYREVPWGEVYYRQFNGRCMMRLAFSYGNKLEAFAQAMKTMGAIPVKAGDSGFQFEIFPGYFVQFLLWAGDEEFPPSSQILFSDNFTAAFHAEDLVVVCDVAIGTLKKL
ncbi:MAG: DUF3786 domain-containing protein [Lachnospiraceae bacterium]|nr:DUF3786 domain-containing protein [Lachnospiraceae bacterium]